MPPFRGTNDALRSLLFILGMVLAQSTALAQSSTSGATEHPSTDADQSPAVFEHSPSSRFWISGQINIIFQGHPSFRAKYSGENSLKAQGEIATSHLLTLYTGLQLTKTTEVVFDVESAGGRGISEALGIAGFTNLDVVRSPDLHTTPYLARLMIRKIIPLTHETAEAERGPLSLASELPARRLEVRVGKLSIVDFFDVNSVGSDSHLQFMNWAVDNNGAYDYAANTRGYTWSGMVEYQDRRWGARFAESLMPKVANGRDLDANLSRAHAENAEVEIRRKFISHRDGVLRLLAYVNHANMGSYREAIDAFRAGRESEPNIEAHRRQGRIKYGFGVNIEQAITARMRAFGRWGWNEGRHESFAYTEVDQSVSLGADLRGDSWHRRQDKIGASLVINSISGDHREYLALGGHGFLLGDGRLTYGHERILEGYYTLHLWRGVFASVDLQHVTNPGYNRDRGPVLVPALRLHVDL